MVTLTNSYEDETWAPKEKQRKVYCSSDEVVDDEDETPTKKGRVCSQNLTETLPLPPLSPVMHGMLEKLAVSKDDISKRRQALDKLGASSDMQQLDTLGIDAALLHSPSASNKTPGNNNGKQEDNPCLSEPKCETNKKSTQKKTKCGKCSSEVVCFARHLKKCLKKK